ncbi:MAG: hypothetical protein ACP5FY_07335 [Kosmotogaceae bacterium]
MKKVAAIILIGLIAFGGVALAGPGLWKIPEGEFTVDGGPGLWKIPEGEFTVDGGPGLWKIPEGH